MRLALLGPLLFGCSTAQMAIDDAGLDVDGAARPDGELAPDGAPLPAGPRLVVFGDDYGDDVGYAPFGGSTGGPSIVADDPHGGATSLRIEVPPAGYTGGAFRSGVAVDLSGFSIVSFWARASRPVTLDVVGLGNDAATATFWAEQTAIALDTGWSQHVVPLPDPARLTAERGLFHVAEGSDEGSYTLWLDDIAYQVADAGLVAAPTPAIATESIALAIGASHLVNGASITYQIDGAPQTLATSRRYFGFTSSAPEAAAVDDEGRVTAVAAGAATITARLGAIDAIGALSVEVHQ
jgi:hypothetical protein